MSTKSIAAKSVNELTFDELQLEESRCEDYLASFSDSYTSKQTKQIKKRLKEIKQRLDQDKDQ